VGLIEWPSRGNALPHQFHPGRVGIGALPAGQRWDGLTRTLYGLLDRSGDRVLPLDTDAAHHDAALAVAARTADHGFPTQDGSIAAIVAWRGLIVAS
jgi:predicted nucleic acid-binding protein